MFAHTCDVIGRRGWHERSSGGLSVKLDCDTLLQIEGGLTFDKEFIPLEIPVPKLGKEFVMLNADNIHIEDVSRYPEDLSGIIQISPDGKAYRTVMGFDGGMLSPMMDLQLHLVMHEMKVKEGLEDTVVFHVQPANLVALTYLLELDDRTFSEALWRSSAKCPEMLPRGIGIVSESVNNNKDLCRLVMEHHNDRDVVVLAFHGLVIAGSDMMDVVGMTETIEKAAEIRMKLLQVPSGIRQEPRLPFEF